MSESVFPSAEDRALAQESNTQISGGAMLREAREALGLHIDALAVLLKVPVKKLEALEADQFDKLPDTVFVRALASSVCRTLKIDPDPILARLPVTTAPPLKTDESGINTPFRVTGEGVGLAFWEQLSKPFVLAVLVLLIGVVVLVFFPVAQLPHGSGDSKSGIAAETSPLSMPTPAPMTTENLATAGGATQMQSSGPALLLSDAPLALNPVSVMAASPLPVVTTSAAPALVSGSGATTGLILLKSRGPSWVEVVDASGVVQVRKNMTVGEVLDVSGVIPLSVVVGSADTVEVQVRGKPFDLTRVAKNNVARFEVK